MRGSLIGCLAATTLLISAPVSSADRWPVQTEPLGDCVPISASLDPVGRDALARGAPGLVVGVSRRGRPPLVQAWGDADLESDVPLRAESVFRIASLTKQFTAALILDLVDEGTLSLEDRAARYLPEQAWLGDVTVYQLLVQTSGLPDYAQDPEGDAGKARARSTDEMLAWIGRLAERPDFSPGERWAYSNSNYTVLGAIIERLTGQSFDEAMTARVLGPSGLSMTAVDDPRDLVPNRVSGYSRRGRGEASLANAAWIHPSMPGPAGSLRSTAGDLLKWNEALYSGALLSDSSVSRMTAPGLLADGRTTRFGMPQAWQDGLKSDYAMGLFVSDSVLGPRLWHSGDIDGFTAWMAHYPQAGVTIVMLQNGDFLDLDHAAVEQIVAGAGAC